MNELTKKVSNKSYFYAVLAPNLHKSNQLTRDNLLTLLLTNNKKEGSVRLGFLLDNEQVAEKCCQALQEQDSAKHRSCETIDKHAYYWVLELYASTEREAAELKKVCGVNGAYTPANNLGELYKYLVKATCINNQAPIIKQGDIKAKQATSTNNQNQTSKQTEEHTTSKCVML